MLNREIIKEEENEEPNVIHEENSGKDNLQHFFPI
jgi:hypothetical protein